MRYIQKTPVSLLSDAESSDCTDGGPRKFCSQTFFLSSSDEERSGCITGSTTRFSYLKLFSSLSDGERSGCINGGTTWSWTLFFIIF